MGLIQESHLAPLDDKTYVKEFPHFHVYHSNLGLHTGGLITLVRKTYAKHYTIGVVPLSAHAKGRVLALSFALKASPEDTRAHFNLVKYECLSDIGPV